MFFNRKVPPAEEVKLVELVKLVDDHTGILVGINKRIGDLELEIEKLKTHINSLRGFLNRRLSGQDLPGETSKSDDGLDSLRK